MDDGLTTGELMLEDIAAAVYIGIFGVLLILLVALPLVYIVLSIITSIHPLL